MRVFSIVLAMVLVAPGIGCAAKKTATAPSDEVKKAVAAAPAVKAPAPAESQSTKVRLESDMVSYAPVYFDFDSHQLRSDAQRQLDGIAGYLTRHPDEALVVEGHCDERGTVEYNMALGDQRARTISEYLIRLGVKQGQIRTITYGEERPAVEGHSESAWAKNRRGEFIPPASASGGQVSAR